MPIFAFERQRAWDRPGLSSKKKTTYETRLIEFSLQEKQTEIIDTDILNPNYAEIRYHPQKDLLALRDECKDNREIAFIKVFNLKFGENKIISRHSSSRPQGQISWSQNGDYILFCTYESNNDRRLLYNKLVSLNGEERIIEAPNFDGYQLIGVPGQISSNSDQFIVYTERAEMDIWMLGGKQIIK